MSRKIIPVGTASWHDRSRTSTLVNEIWLTGILGGVVRINERSFVKFRLNVNWLSPDDDPPSSAAIAKSGLADSEMRLFVRLTGEGQNPLRFLGNRQIGFTCVLKQTDGADALEAQLNALVSCRLDVRVKLHFYRFEMTKNGETKEVRGLKLDVKGINSEGVAMEF